MRIYKATITRNPNAVDKFSVTKQSKLFVSHDAAIAAVEAKIQLILPKKTDLYIQYSTDDLKIEIEPVEVGE